MAKFLESAVTVVLCVFASVDLGVCVSSSRRRTSIRKVSVDEDTVIFPDTFHDIMNGRSNSNNHSITSRSGGSKHSHNGEMPLDLARRLSESNDIDSFFQQNFENSQQFFDDFSAMGRVTVSGRFGSDDAKPLVPKGAGCIPEMTVVPLLYPNIKDPSAFHMPTCTRVPRCGGCCNNELLSCQPFQAKNVTYQVLQLKQNSKGAMYKGYVNVTVEEHVRCKCNCVIKKEDCPIHQQYVERECRCICPNRSLEVECHNSGRRWDSDDCACRCAEVKECTTGTVFDNNSCSCRR